MQQRMGCGGRGDGRGGEARIEVEDVNLVSTLSSFSPFWLSLAPNRSLSSSSSPRHRAEGDIAEIDKDEKTTRAWVKNTTTRKGEHAHRQTSTEEDGRAEGCRVYAVATQAMKDFRRRR